MHLAHAVLQYLQPFLPLRSADDLADPREQDVHRAHGLAVLVHFHVECFDVLRIIRQDHRPFEVVHQEVLVLLLQVRAPVHRELELLARVFQDLDRRRIGEPLERVIHDHLQSWNQLIVVGLGQELDVVATVLQRVSHQVLEKILRQVLVVADIVKRHLRLDHPELRQVTRRVGVLRAESRTEGVNVTQRGRRQLAFQLARYGQVGRLTEKVFFEVDRSVGKLRQVLQIQRGHLEHLARALRVGPGDDRGVEVIETTVVEVLVDGKRHVVTQPEDGAEGVRTRTQVRDLAQELERMSFLLQRIRLIRVTEDLDRLRLDLHGLPRSLRSDQLARRPDAGAGGHALDQLLRKLRHLGDHLDAVDHGTVVHRDERDLLVPAPGPDPAPDFDRLIGRFRS